MQENQSEDKHFKPGCFLCFCFCCVSAHFTFLLLSTGKHKGDVIMNYMKMGSQNVM